MDPYIVLSWVDTGLSVLANGLTVASQLAGIVLAFI
jgi:hypothetical protein